MTTENYLSGSMQQYTGSFPDDNAESITKNNFIVLNLISANTEKVPYVWDVKFSIDHSGSMSDNCNDGRTKMQHIKHVIINILRLFVSESYANMEINVCVHIFDGEDERLFDFTRITKLNVDILIAKIDNIHPLGSTNLLEPFEITNMQMENRAAYYPNNKRVHFILTDGFDTCDNTTTTIVNSVSSDYATIVFGFGIDHDYDTLMKMGAKSNVDYAFIDDLEKSGFVYGEYLHKLFHICIEDIRLEIDDGKIYDWTSNSWLKELTIDSMAAGLTKNYYIRTESLANVVCKVYGKICDIDRLNIVTILDTVCFVPIAFCDTLATLLERHIYRYKTLRLLHESQNNTKNDDIKNRLKMHFNSMKQFVQDNNLKKDALMKGLLDDIYMVHKSYGTRHLKLYTNLRQRSQGNQTVYTVTTQMPNNRQDTSFTSTPMKLSFPHLRRKMTNNIPIDNGIPEKWDNIDFDDTMDQHELTQLQDVYSSPCALKIMREVSNTIMLNYSNE